MHLKRRKQSSARKIPALFLLLVLIISSLLHQVSHLDSAVTCNPFRHNYSLLHFPLFFRSRILKSAVSFYIVTEEDAKLGDSNSMRTLSPQLDNQNHKHLSTGTHGNLIFDDRNSKKTEEPRKKVFVFWYFVEEEEEYDRRKKAWMCREV